MGPDSATSKLFATTKLNGALGRAIGGEFAAWSEAASCHCHAKSNRLSLRVLLKLSSDPIAHWGSWRLELTDLKKTLGIGTRDLGTLWTPVDEMFVGDS